MLRSDRISIYKSRDSEKRAGHISLISAGNVRRTTSSAVQQQQQQGRELGESGREMGESGRAPLADERAVIEIETATRIFHLSADTDAELQRWLVAIQALQASFVQKEASLYK